MNDAAAYGLDAAAFEQAIATAQTQQQARGKLSRTGVSQLQTAVSLYHGDFLAGFTIRNAPEFEAWVLLEQERLRQMFLVALTDLITFYQQRGQLAAAISCGQRLLATDPLQEDIHRQLMTLYVQDNQRPAALAQYEHCVRVLDEELGIEPDEETMALYRAIKADKVGAARSPSPLVTRSPGHNIVAAANTFMGQEAELATIAHWLAEPEGRLLTITGPGGMGKTRLAQEAARAHLGQFADEVWFVSLVAVQDWPEGVTAIADTLGLSLSGKESLTTQLLNQLKPLETLLLLDNLEHLLNDDLREFLSQLTQTAPICALSLPPANGCACKRSGFWICKELPSPRVVSCGQPTVTSGQSAVSR